MDIYSILQSKPHNPHYLQRYYRFILTCKEANAARGITKRTKKNPNGIYMESHHICPKAKSMFPQFKSFKDFSWNKIELTGRQHYIAHLMLWKSYGSAMTYAFFKSARYKGNSRFYESAKSQYFLENSGENHWMNGRTKSERWKESRSGANNNMFGKLGSDSPNYGRIKSEEELLKLRKPKSNTEKYKKPKSEAWKNYKKTKNRK